MIRVILFTLSMFFAYYSSISQIKGNVISASNSEPIPYVNIGCMAKGIGTVSNENGSFEIKGISAGDTLLFSSIGYKRAIHIVKSDSEIKIKLLPETKVLDEVTIISQKPKDAKFAIKGEQIKRRSHSLGFAGENLGTEIGSYLKINKPYKVSNAIFAIERIGDNNALKLRVNIYEFKHDGIGKNLITKNIILKAPKEPGLIDVDLTNLDLILETDVLLMLELVQDDKGKKSQDIMFRAKKSGDNIYWRPTSFGKYNKLSDLFKGAPKLSIGFYLKGYEY